MPATLSDRRRGLSLAELGRYSPELFMAAMFCTSMERTFRETWKQTGLDID